MIIGLTGYAQSGKDTVASTLVNKYGFTRVAFADKIRELLYEMDPLVPQGQGGEFHLVGLQNFVDIYGWDDAKQDPVIRSMLQTLGVGARKTFGESFWVHEAMKTMLNDPRPDLNYVITDVRFLNEADMIRANKGQLWRIKRLGVEAVNNHVSEHELDNYAVDQIFTNNGTLEDLEAMISARMVALV